MKELFTTLREKCESLRGREVTKTHPNVFFGEFGDFRANVVVVVLEVLVHPNNVFLRGTEGHHRHFYITFFFQSGKKNQRNTSESASENRCYLLLNSFS